MSSVGALDSSTAQTAAPEARPSPRSELDRIRQHSSAMATMRLRTEPGTEAAESAYDYQEVWHYRRELLPKGVSYLQVDAVFITKKGYGIVRPPARLGHPDDARRGEEETGVESIDETTRRFPSPRPWPLPSPSADSRCRELFQKAKDAGEGRLVAARPSPRWKRWTSRPAGPPTRSSSRSSRRRSRSTAACATRTWTGSTPRAPTSRRSCSSSRTRRSTRTCTRRRRWRHSRRRRRRR